MPAQSPDPLVNVAAATRLGVLLHLRGPDGPMLVANQLMRGLPYTMPATWHSMPVADQAQGLVRAEARRIADARLYALDDNAVSAVRAVADDLQVRMPVTAGLLPAPSGMIVFASPVSVSPDEGIITAATWGPAMEGFGEGIHLSWWTDTQAFIAREVAAGHLHPAEAEFRKRTFGPLMLHIDMHLPFVPLVDGRLFPVAELTGTDRDSAPAIRAIAAAWYALKHGLLPVREERADTQLGRALTAEKAKHRGVLMGRAEDTAVLAAAVSDQARAEAGQFGSKIMGGLSSPGRARPGEIDEVFLPSRDEELESSQRWVPQLYRDSARPLEALEAEAQQRYPGIFDHLEELRAREYGSWPQWCWMPYSRVATAIGELGLSKDVDRILQDAVVIAGLGAWRARGRPTVVLDWLPAEEDRFELPPDCLPDQLPLFGAALVHTDLKDGTPVYQGGRLAFLDYNTDKGRAELLCLDHDHGSGIQDVYEWQLLLIGSTLAEAAEATAAVSLLPEKPSGGRYTREELAGVIDQAVGVYFPFFAILADPGRHKAVVAEAGAALGRRQAQVWPPAAGEGRHTTLWLVRPLAAG